MTDRKHDTESAGKYLGVPGSTLRYWRGRPADAKGEHGPRFAKLGHRVVYLESDLDAFLTARLQEAG
jgi:hypothetical protein